MLGDWGGLVGKEDKLLLVEMCLGRTATHQYDAQVQSRSHFQTYQALTLWLRATYIVYRQRLSCAYSSAIPTLYTVP